MVTTAQTSNVAYEFELDDEGGRLRTAKLVMPDERATHYQCNFDRWAGNISGCIHENCPHWTLPALRPEPDVAGRKRH